MDARTSSFGRVIAMLGLLLVGPACAGSPASNGRSTPSAGTPEAVIAFRHTAEVRFADEDAEAAERTRGHLYVIPGADGAFRVRYQEDEDEQRFLPIDDAAAVLLYFPSPPEPEAIERTFRVSRLDRDEPLVLSERIWREGEADGGIQIGFERKGRIDTGDPHDPTVVQFVQRGRGTYLPAEGRYHDMAIEYEARDPGGMVAGRVTLRFDPEESERRIRREREIRAAIARGAQEYGRSRDVHAPEAELARVEARLRAAGEEPVDLSALEWFHAHAHPVELWKLLLDEPLGSGARAHLQRLLVVAPMLAGERPPDEVIAFMRHHLDDRDVARAAILLSDPRLEPEVRRLAESSDPELREAARAALLERLDLRPTAEDVRAVVSDPDRFLELAVVYAWREEDPRPLVPVLVDALRSAEPFLAEHLVELLQAITFRPYGADVDRWQTFYDTHASLPYRDWIVGATEEPGHEARIAAYEALGYEAAFDAGAAALQAGLRERDPRLRLAAAGSLARWHRPEAAPVLVSFLAAPEFETRVTAFTALADLSRSSLGYDPSAEDVDRAEALGRWRAWAKEQAGGSELARNLRASNEGFLRN